MKLFGTDGIRGEANAEPMTADTALRVGRAAACVFRRASDRRHNVIIGKDTRLSGYLFETALASGFCSMGVDVVLIGPMPTPGIAFLASEARADAGVVISASHNPYNDNGIKFFGPDGFKLADSVEESIEKLVASSEELNAQRPEAGKVGKAQRLDDARGRYISYLKFNFPKQLSLEGLKVVLDCANGATYRIAPQVFGELGASLVLRGVKPNGTNINVNCGALKPEVLAKEVKKNNADVGIAFDGDGDRVVVCDEKGQVFDGDDILAILSSSMQTNGELGKGVVGTVMSNFGLEMFFKKKKIDFFRAQVGDRYVVETMRSVSSNLGGEQSGHVVCLGRSTTGDGMLTGLLVLAEMLKSQKPLSAYHQSFERFPQVLVNVKVRERKALESLPPVLKCIKDAEDKLSGAGRVLVRYSGTEPKARIMVEGQNGQLVKQLADDIATVLQKEIGVN
jgi:phosphoglucosamine mutase